MIRTEYPKCSCIYQIQSKANREIYIGSTHDFRMRKSAHLRELMGGKHGNIKLQRHVNTYGIIDLVFNIKGKCVESQLKKREQYWIDKLQPEFNIAPRSDCGFTERKHSEKTKEKMSISHLKRYENPKQREKTSLAMKVKRNRNASFEEINNKTKKRAKAYREQKKLEKIKQYLEKMEYSVEFI